MPSGTLAISKTRTTPATYELMFLANFTGSHPPLAVLTIDSLEELRSVLSNVGVESRHVDKAIRDAIRDGVALLHDVVLTDTFIAKHQR